MYNTLKGIPHHHHIKVTAGAKKDMLMWLQFSNDFKCCRPIPSFNYVTNAQLGPFTDALKKLGNGCGIIFKYEWAQACWDKEFLDQNSSIMLLELFPIIMSILIWGKKLENQHIILQSESESAVAAANAQFSSCDLCMTLICFLVLECLCYNTDLKCQHISGIKKFGQ